MTHPFLECPHNRQKYSYSNYTYVELILNIVVQNEIFYVHCLFKRGAKAYENTSLFTSFVPDFSFCPVSIFLSHPPCSPLFSWFFKLYPFSFSLSFLLFLSSFSLFTLFFLPISFLMFLCLPSPSPFLSQPV